jgi:hypothetical protein
MWNMMAMLLGRFHGYEKNTYHLQLGDVLILPEVKQCPVTLLKKGVQVYNWHLAIQVEPVYAKRMNESKQRGCKVKVYIGDLEKLPRQTILRPFISPSMIVPKEEIVALKKKGNLILIDDDTPAHVKDAVFDHCVQLGCEAILSSRVSNRLIYWLCTTVPRLFWIGAWSVLKGCQLKRVSEAP